MTAQSWYPGPSGSLDPEDERPLGELFSDLTRSVQVLIRKEVELAKVELKEQTSRATKGIAMLAVGGVGGLFALLLLSFAAAWGLAEVIPTGFAFLIVGVVYLLVAVPLLLAGKKKLAEVNPVPRQAVETLKQDAEVAKASWSRGARY
jgi:uncharacterized membrane protein YqjE